MTAGQSAELESRRQNALADEHERLAALARQTAANYNIAAITEKSVARTLSPLAAVGYFLLPDRRWPGSKTAQVDLVVVGPAGVFIVDTKAWADVTIAGGHVYRGQADVTDDLAGIADLAYGVEGVLADLGLAPGEVHAVIALAGRQGIKEVVGTLEIVGEKDVARHILSRGNRLTATQVNAVLAATLDHFPVLGTEVTPVDASVTSPVLAEIAPPEPELLVDEEVSAAILEGLMAAPIEEWMSFLHPDQAKLVRRSFNGPSRIRGAAGTGKTVVGLHRAAYLARSREGQVLVTTFIRTLPDVLSNLLERMSPDIARSVEFVGVYKFALDLLRQRGIRCTLNAAKADLAFTTAWREVGAPGPLGKTNTSERYWRDEIASVIKGRGLTSFEQYADLARTGRRRRLTTDQRKAVWQLFTAYEQGLRSAGVHDFADVILMAEASLRSHPLSRYSAVIIDEAQDLSCAMVRMLHLLVGDRDDGITLIGDGQQTIYPGGFTLPEAGISISGRGVVMSTNYRNTAEIVEFAAAMVSGDEFVDIEGAAQSGDGIQTVVRRGPQPVSQKYASRQAHDSSLVAHIRDVAREVGTGLGDIGVLSLTSYGVRDAIAALTSAGIPYVELEKYDGKPSAAVKVGTVKRAKGLEFKQVLLANVAAKLLEPAAPSARQSDDDAVHRDHRELNRRELYVAMTRARDGLWVGLRS